MDGCTRRKSGSVSEEEEVREAGGDLRDLSTRRARKSAVVRHIPRRRAFVCTCAFKRAFVRFASIRTIRSSSLSSSFGRPMQCTALFVERQIRELTRQVARHARGRREREFGCVGQESGFRERRVGERRVVCVCRVCKAVNGHPGHHQSVEML